MGKIAQELGVQSYCFRGFKDNKQVARMVRQIGVKRIEVCGVHIDFSKREQHKPCIDAYGEQGVQIASIGVENIGVEEAKLRDRAEFCKACGAKVISANFNPGTSDAQLKLVHKIAREYDLYFAIHNHGGYHWLGNSQILEWVFSEAEKRGDDRLGLCIDTAWALDARQNPVEMADKFAKRLFGIHIKDFVFDRARKSTDVVVGTGNLDLPAFIRTVEKNNFKGSCVLEYEGDVNDPVPALAKCVEAVNAAS